MVQNKKVDRRVLYTKMFLRESLLALLKEKPIAKITTSELCRHAAINRNTFYTHYDSPEALLKTIEEELYSQVKQSIERSLGNGSISALLTEICQAIYDNRDLCAVLFSEYGEPIVSEKWIDAATSVQIQTPNGEMKHGYGYQIWMSDEEGAFQFNGAFGQYVLVFPKYDAVIAMYSGSASLFAHVGLSERVKQLLDTFKDEALQENGQAGASLKKCLDGLTYSPSYPDELGMDKEEFERIAYRLDGKEYLAGPNTGGFFPQTLQVVHGNMTDSVSMFRFAKRGDDIILYIYEKDERNALVLKHDGSFELGAVTIRGERQLTGTRCRWKLEPRHIRLYVLSSFIETPNSRILKIGRAHV